MAQRELDGEIGQGRAMLLGDAGELAGPLQQRGRGLGVLVGRGVRHLVLGEQPRVEHGDRDDAHAVLEARFEQLVGPGLLEQGVAAREHDQIDQARAHGAQQHAGVLGADADGAHQALVPHPGERRQTLGEGLLGGPLLRVVREQDVHPVQAQTLEGLGVRAAHPGLGVVPFAHMVIGHGEGVVHVIAGTGPGQQQPAHLGGDQVLLTRIPRQTLAEPPLAGADPVVGSGVEVADPGLPGGADRPVGLLVAGLPVEVPELRGAESQPRQLERAVAAHASPSAGPWSGRDQTGRIPESSPP